MKLSISSLQLLFSALFLCLLTHCASPPLQERFIVDKESKSEEYTIEAYSYRIIQTLDLASHNFWVLKDPQKRLVAEIHGLSTDRQSGYTGPVGTDDQKFSLRAQHFVYDRDFYDYLKKEGKISEIVDKTGMADTLYIKYSPTNLHRKKARHVIVFKGSEKEAFDRWESAVDSMIYINHFDQDYPAFGFNLSKKTINSNALYRTLGESMGLPIYYFRGVTQPGINHRLLSPATIEHHRDKRYPVLATFESDELIDNHPIKRKNNHAIEALIEAQQRPTSPIQLDSPYTNTANKGR